MADEQENKKANNMDEEVKKLEGVDEAKEFEKCYAERDEYLNGWKRAKADLINYQKDETRRFEEFAKYSSKELIRELITVMDSFDLAIGTMGDNVDKGMLMIRTQLEDVLKKQGLERLGVSVGAPFDPAVHEAVAAVESVESPGAVVEEVGRGYALNGRVIRPARVKVAKEHLTSDN